LANLIDEDLLAIMAAADDGESESDDAIFKGFLKDRVLAKVRCVCSVIIH
jgi:hypothetical protein